MDEHSEMFTLLPKGQNDHSRDARVVGVLVMGRLLHDPSWETRYAWRSANVHMESFA